MTDRYVRSTTGSDANNGTTWALAKATINGLAAIDTAGDRLFVSQVHAETTANTAVSWAFAGSVTNPTNLICGNDGAQPPTAVATTGTVGITGTGTLSVNGTAYIYGLTFTFAVTMAMCGSGGDQYQTYENCSFIWTNVGSAGQLLQQALAARNVVRLKNCTLKPSATSSAIIVSQEMLIQGGSFVSGLTTPTAGFFQMGNGGRGARCLVEDFDFSNASSSLVLVNAANSSQGVITFRNCKMPTSWVTGSLKTGSFSSFGGRAELFGCSDGTKVYALQIADYCGSISQDTTVYRNGGASDGTTPMSWAVTSNTTALYPMLALATPEIVIWNDTTGSSKTATIEIATVGTTLNNNDIWVELSYYSSSSTPIGTLISSAPADILTSAGAVTTSSATWAGGTIGITQKLQVTFTPQMKGPIYARVFVAKASQTVSVDPVITVS